jgi:predicted phosphoribosyltransferase
MHKYGTRFSNRTEAGKKLAIALSKYADRSDVLVLGLPPRTQRTSNGCDRC